MTRRIALSLALVLLCVSFSSGKPEKTLAAGSYVFETDMYGYNVVPAVSTQAWGFLRFFFDDSHTTADITIDVKGVSDSLVTGADIRRGRPGTNGPVVRHLSDGGFIVAAARIRFTASELNEMAAGNWYASLTTTLNPEGEIRGQITTPANFLTPGSTPPPLPFAQPPSLPGQNTNTFPTPAAPPPQPRIIAAAPLLAPPPIPAVLPAGDTLRCLADCGLAAPPAPPAPPAIVFRPPNTGDGGLAGR